MKELICIVCPNGCHLHYEEDGTISGAVCLSSTETLGHEKTFGANFTGKDAAGVDAVDTISGATKTTQAYKNAMKDALNAAIKGLAEPGCHILIDNYAHNAVYRPVRALADAGLAEFDLFDASGEDDEIPYNEQLVSAAFPYGMARWIFRENDDVSGSHEYYQLYATALMEATPLEVVEITDVYR